MGDLAFGETFNMLTLSEDHWVIKLLNRGIGPLGYHFPVWFFRMMVAVPRLADDWWQFVYYCTQKVDERITASTARSADA